MSQRQDAQREFAVEVVRRLRAAGHEALWAGGCVRYQLLGRMPKDYDVATSALPDQVRLDLALAQEHKFGSGTVYLCYHPA
jgi:tRNA nucleotidyltransferase/poly(A) polymerase